MKRPEAFPTNLELRESNPDGSAGAGLSHTPGGMFLLRVLELAAAGEPRGGVTIVHDAGDHGARYEELAQVLAAQGWAVSMPDLRGHGHSEGERGHSWGFEEVRRDLCEAQDHLCFMFPEAPKVLIGQGLGGLYSLAFALEQPERVAALVLCAPLLAPKFALPAAKGGLMGMFKKLGPKSAGSIGYAPEQLTREPAELAALRADALRHDVITLHAGQAALQLAERVSARLGELAMPVLVLQGTADAIAPESGARKLAGPKRELVRIEGGLHDVLHDTGAAQVCADIRAWLERVLPR